MTRTIESNCVDILRPFLEKNGSAPDIRLIGGIGMTALLNKEAKISTKNNQIEIPPHAVQLSNIRENGTTRDVDLLVLTSDDDRITAVKKELGEATQGALDLSVFGVRPEYQLEDMYVNPFGTRAVSSFVSDRYEALNAGGKALNKVLFPFAVDIDPEALEPWQLKIGDMAVNIPHPAVSVVNYTNRSISGVRKKDSRKITELMDRLQSDVPETVRYMSEGPAASQLELARVIHSAGVGIEPLNRALGSCLQPIDKAELLDHPAYMMQELSPAKSKAMMGIFAIKANSLRKLEGADSISTFWQKHIETTYAKNFLGVS